MAGTKTQPARALSAFPYLEGSDQPATAHLVAAECADCGKRVFPPAPVCPECMGETMRPLPLGREGTLYSYTVYHQGARWIDPPYIVGYVDMPEGVRVFAHITDIAPDKLECDMKVSLRITEPVVNPDGFEVLGFKFGPAE